MTLCTPCTLTKLAKISRQWYSELSSGLYCRVKWLSTGTAVWNDCRQYNPEDSSEHHTRRSENLKSHICRQVSPFFSTRCVCCNQRPLVVESGMIRTETGAGQCNNLAHLQTDIFKYLFNIYPIHSSDAFTPLEAPGSCPASLTSIELRLELRCGCITDHKMAAVRESLCKIPRSNSATNEHGMKWNGLLRVLME
jgi:hypothetical protein